MKPLLLLLSLLAFALETNGGEHCIGSDGHPYYCNGFCCSGLGCCSYSSLWYAWGLLALVAFACLCGCATCGMRRYHLIHQSAQYRRMSSYPNGRPERARRTDRLTTSRYPRVTYNAVNQGYRSGNNLPPPYSGSSAPPPPYSEHC